MSNASSQVITTRLAEALERDVRIPDHLSDFRKHGEYKDLIQAPVVYHSNQSVIDLIGIRQYLGLYSKCSYLPIDVDRRQAAYDKFLESEDRCRKINRLFRVYPRTDQYDPYVESILFLTQRKIANILGECPSLSDLQCSFGPGSSANVKKNTSLRWKLSSRPTCSMNMLSIISDALAEVPLYTSFWADLESSDSWSVPVDVFNGELMFVPKNALTDRTIIVEPSLNTYFQKGVGNYLKDRLMAVGVDLSDQSESKGSNRQLARLGSLNDENMTIDLSSASDSISKGVVQNLLPIEWYDLLSSLRTSEVYSKDFDSSFELEKFSSMGNGFTFELESLIFYSLVHSILYEAGLPTEVNVYGDDIICSNLIYDKLVQVFSFLGFEINSSKSYVSGPFRESCGGDYFLGQDIRPYYHKQQWCMADLFSLHNFCIRKGLNFLLPSFFEEVLKFIPISVRIFGPDGFGDGHLLGAWTPLPYRRNDGWGGVVFFTYTQSVRKYKYGLLPGDYILPFYTAGSTPGFCPFSVRGSTGKCKRIRVYTLSRN